MTCLAFAFGATCFGQGGPPTINQQPQSQTVNSGSSVSFTVTVSSVTTVSYQWKFNGVNIPGATSGGGLTSTYTIGYVQPGHAGNYSVGCTNAAGGVVSANATLTVNAPNLIPGQPPGWSDKIVVSTTPGTSTDSSPLTTNDVIYVDLAIQNVGTAATSGTFSNEFFLDGVLQGTFTVGSAIPIGFFATYQDYVLGPLAAGSHTLKIKADSSNGVVESNESDNEYTKTITVFPDPGVLVQPQSQTVTQGVTVVFTATARGTEPFTYQWAYNGIPIAGATDPTYSIANVQYRQRGNYSVTVTNGIGSATTSSNAALTVTLLPGTVAAWGDESFGVSTVPETLNGVKAIAAGGWHSLALRTNGTVVAWGDNSEGQTNIPPGLTNVTGISGGAYHSLALRDDGTVVAWGYWGYGVTNVPFGLSNVTAIGCGYFDNVALRSNGTVTAWGYNFEGEADVPPGLSNVVAIAACPYHNLALKSDGTIVGWGTNAYGELNPPAGLSGVVALAGGVGFSLALKNNGTVVAWGDNSGGQTNVPPGLTNVIAIAAGDFHCLALKADGTLASWGYYADFPGGLTNMTAVAAFQYHSLGLKGDGSVVITQQPLTQKVNRGANATFVVMAAGNATLRYQWRFNGTNLANATRSSFTRTNVQPASAGLYSVTVSNAFGLLLSSNASLIIENPLMLTAGSFVSTGFPITVTGPSSVSVVVEASTTVSAPINWTPIYTNNTGPGGSFTFTDTAAAGLGRRFYRARQ